MVWHCINNVIHVRLLVRFVKCIHRFFRFSLMLLVLKKKSLLGCAFHFCRTLEKCGMLQKHTCVCLFAVACERPETYP